MSSRPGLGIAATAFVTGVCLAAGLGIIIRRTAFLAALYLPRQRPRSSARDAGGLAVGERQ